MLDVFLYSCFNILVSVDTDTVMRPTSLGSNAFQIELSLLSVFLFATVLVLPNQVQAQDASSAGASADLVEPASSSEAPGPPSSKGPRVTTLNGPAKAYAGEPVTYTARVSRDGLESSLGYQWQFGDNRPEIERGGDATAMVSKHLSKQSKLVATHRYDQPGTYTVTFSAKSDAGETSASATVTITDSLPSSSDESARMASAQNIQEAQTSGSAVMADRPGQWGIVVASMRSARKAEVAAEQYQDRLGAERMPVEVMEARLPEGRYFRVIVGRFESETSARRTIISREETFPVRAWTVRYQKRFLSGAGN